jgi:hypothetical protein
VIVSPIFSQDYLLAGAYGEAKLAWFAVCLVRQREASNDHARCDEARYVALRCAALDKSAVGFHFRPEKPRLAGLRDVVLEDVVPVDGVTQLLGIGDGKRSAEG